MSLIIRSNYDAIHKDFSQQKPSTHKIQPRGPLVRSSGLWTSQGLPVPIFRTLIIEATLYDIRHLVLHTSFKTSFVLILIFSFTENLHSGSDEWQRVTERVHF